MRLAKTEALRKELKFIQQNYEREVDSKDAIIFMLDRDIDEADEQYQMALKNHMLHVDRLVAIQESRLQGLNEEFQRDLNILKAEFESEKNHIEKVHESEVQELKDMIATVQEEEERKEREAKEEHEGEREENKNHNIEATTSMRTALVNKTTKLQKDFDTKFSHYISETKGKTTEFEALVKSTDDASKEINRYVKNIDRLKNSIAYWRSKGNQNTRECNARNTALLKEKEKIQKHYQDLKIKMQQFREDQAKRLTELTVNSKKCSDLLKDDQKLGEKILKTAELCRKLETEKEKVLPFYKNDPESTAESKEEEPEEIKGIPSSQYNEYSQLEEFYKRYNKVTLDKLAIEKQKNTLEKENMFFKSLLKQYLDGVSVNDDVMNSNNPLMIVNNKISLNRPPVEKIEERKPILEGNKIVNEIKLQNVHH